MYHPAQNRSTTSKGKTSDQKEIRRKGKRPANHGCIEALESRIAPAYSMTLSLGATVGVSSSVVGNTITYTANAHGANLNWQDIENSLATSLNIVINSGSGGAEDGNITDLTGAQLGAPIGSNLNVTFQSGTGAGLIGDIHIHVMTMQGANESLTINAAGNASFDLLCADLAATPAKLSNVSITAGRSIGGGSIYSNTLSMSASTGVGSSGAPINTFVNNIVAKNTSSGGIFISNTGDLTVGFASDPFRGIIDSGASTDQISLTSTGNVFVTNSSVANEIISAPGKVSVVTTGASSDIVTGESQNVFSDPNAALRGSIVSVNDSVMLTAGRDLLIGGSSNLQSGNVIAGGSMNLNAGRDIIVDSNSLVSAASISATAGGNISLQQAHGAGAHLLTQGGQIALVTGAGGTFTAQSGGSPADVTSNGGLIVINADNVGLTDASSLNAGTGIAQIAPVTAGRAIDLGTNPSAGMLDLSTTDLSHITAGILRIGDLVNTGNINFSTAISAPAGWKTLSLLTGSAGNVTQSGGAALTVQNLQVDAHSINLPLANNAISQIAATSATSFTLTDSISLTIGTVDAGLGGGLGSGLHTAGAINLTVAGPLLAVNSSVSSANNPITFSADHMSFLAPVNGGASVVALGPVSNLPVSLGATVAGSLNLLQSDLNQVTAGTALKIQAGTGAGITLRNSITAPAGWNTLELQADAIVESNGILTVTNLELQAGTGIGSASPLQVGAGIHIAYSNTTSGLVQISSAGAMTIDSVNGLGASANTGGATNLVAAGPLTFATNVTGAGTITGTASDAAGAGQDITVSAPAVVHTTSGNIVFQAGDNVTIATGASVTSAGTLTIAGDFGNADPGVGTVITVNSAVSGSSITISGNADNDAFKLGIGVLHSGATIDVHGGGGTDSLPITGNGTEDVVWVPNLAADYTGSFTIGTTHLNYDQAAAGVLIPLVTSTNSLTLNTAGPAQFTLDSDGAGHASLAFSQSKILFSAVPVLNVNLGQSEIASDTSGFSIFSLSGDSALGTLAITTGAGTDFVSLKNTLTSLSLPAVGAGLSWIGGTGAANRIDADFEVAGATMTLANSGLTYSTGGTISFPNGDIQSANLIGGNGGQLFGVSGWTGGGTIQGGTGVDTIIATKAGGFTLTNTSLTDSADAMSLQLISIEAANLTDSSAGGHSFDVSAWAGTGTLTGGATDAVVATKAGGFTLTNTSLTDTADAMSLTLNGIGIANLTDNSGAGGHNFIVSGWSGGGSLTTSGTAKGTVIAAKAGGFTLSDTSLSDTADAMSLTLNGVGFANLTDNSAAGGHAFVLTGWTGIATLTTTGTTKGAITVAKSGGFTLTDSLLTDTADSMSLTLNGIGFANLTDNSAAGGHTFNVTGWTGGGSLTTTGTTKGTVIAVKAGGFTLSDNLLSDTADAMSLTLNGIGVANLTDNSAAGGNTFTILDWTGTGTLTNTGTAKDTITAAKASGFTLTDSQLTDTADAMSLTFSGIGFANLTDNSAAGGHIFNVTGWTGGGSLTTTGATKGAVVAVKAGGFTLTDSQLTDTADSMSFTLNGIGFANLADNSAAGGNTFNVSGWTGGGSLTTSGTAKGTVVAFKAGGFTLSDTLLADTADTMSLTLNGIGIANLTDNSAAGGNTFNVSGWTGTGSLTTTGPTRGTVAAAKGGGFTLTDSQLTDSADSMSLVFNGIGFANLTDNSKTGGHTFDVTGWTGGGSLTTTGAVKGTVVALKAGGFTLSDSQITDTADSMNLGLNGIGIANLTDNSLAGGNTFEVSGWTGSGSLIAPGTDTVSATKSAVETLTEGAASSELTAGDGLDLTLTGFSHASLNATQLFINGIGSGSEVATWQPSGTVSNKGTIGLSTLAVDYGVASADSLQVSNFAGVVMQAPDADNHYTLDFGPSNGLGEIAGTSGILSHSLLFTNTTAVTVDYSGNAVAGSTNSLAVNGFAGTGLTNVTFVTGAGSNTLSLTQDLQSLLPAAGGSFQWIAGSGNNTLVASVNKTGASVGQMTLANDGLSYFDPSLQSLGHLAISGVVSTANLTGAPVSGSQTFVFDVSGWTRGGSLTGQGSVANSKLQAVKDVGYQHVSDNAGDLAGTYLATDGISMTLANIGQAQLAGGNGSGGTFQVADVFGTTSSVGNWIDASGFHGTATLIGGESITDTLGHEVGYDLFSAGLGTNFIYAGSQDSRFDLTNEAKLTVLYSSNLIGTGATKTTRNRNLLDFGSATTGVKVNLSTAISYTSGIDPNVQNLPSLKAQNIVTGATQSPATQSDVSSFISTAEAGSTNGWLVLVGVYNDLQGSHFADSITGNKYRNILYGNGELAGTHDVLAGGKGRDFLIGDKLTKFKAQPGIDKHFRYKTLIDSYPMYLPFAINKSTGLSYSTAPFTEPLPPGTNPNPALLDILLPSLLPSATSPVIPDSVVAAVAGLL